MAEWRSDAFDHTVVGLVSFRVRPDQVDEWRQRWQDVARQAQSTPECQYFHLGVNTREDDAYAIITAWKPGNAWLAFIQSVPELTEMQTTIGASPFSFYVLMEEGEPLPW
jgi:quinol monooxygenase YgiN